MKKWMCGLMAAVVALGLTACGGKETAAAWTKEQGQGIVDSGAFSDELDELDLDTACAVYGLDRQHVTDGFVRRSAGATCEEAAVLIFASEDHAKAAAETLSGYVQDQIDENRDYAPAEVPKLENAVLEQRGTSVLLAVANDAGAVKTAVEGLK